MLYSINEEACRILDKHLKDEILSEQEEQYINLLVEAKLLDRGFGYRKYIVQKNEPKLKLVWLEITQACNMKCLHCYEGVTHIKGKQVLSLIQWKKVIDEVEKLKVERIIVIGGEPCLHENVKEILEYLARKDLAVTLFTNAFYLEGELLNTIIQNKTDVKVSLYGHNADIHNKITGVKGSFEKLIRNIEILKENGVNVYVAITLMKENEDYYNEMKKFVKELNVKGVKFDVIRDVIGGNQCEHFPEKEYIIQSVYRKKANFFIRKKNFDELEHHNTCWYGKLVVCENGDVLPCVFERNIKCGNVKENKLEEILRSESLRRCWEFDLSKVDVCCECEYRYACKDCRPMAIAAGNLFGKNPRCLYNPYTGDWGPEHNEKKL